MKNNDFALAALLDIEGFFNHSTEENICLGTKEHAVQDTIEKLMRKLTRSIIINLKKFLHV